MHPTIYAIIESESIDGERFWIAYAPENRASGISIQRAGFALVAELSFDLNGSPVVKDIRAGGGETVSQLLGLPATQDVVAQCWKCVRGPTPADASCATGACSCDYQRPQMTCGA